jgi:dTDP-4-amino-4,6-dideoxygalactose transaminase
MASGRFTPFLSPWLDEEERAVLRAGHAEGGRDRLLAELRRRHGDVAVACFATGRAALVAWLRHAVEPGGEVVIPAFTCRAVADAVQAAGLRAVVADVGDDLGLDAESVTQVWSDRVGAVVVVHFGGTWARDTPQLRRLGAPVLEDAAQASGLIGGDGVLVGTHGPALLSFGLGKAVFGPGGGALVNAPGVQEPERGVPGSVRRYRRWTGTPGQQGRARLAGALHRRLRPSVAEESAVLVGGVGDVDAWVAASMFGRLDDITARRRTNAERWRDLLAGVPLRLAPSVANTFTKCWVVAEDDAAARWVRRELWAVGVETEDLYRPLHLRGDIPDIVVRGPLPVTESVWRRAFSLPVRPNLTADDWGRIERGVARLRRAR